MTRQEEYNRLQANLAETPAALEHIVPRAVARVRRAKRIHRAFAASLGSLAAFFTVFVLLVNLSLPVAMACGNNPLFRKLAAAVAFSPSLRTAIERGYGLPVGLVQTENNITMEIPYVIVDQKQLNIFYTLESAHYARLEAKPQIAESEGFSLTWANAGNAETGDLRRFTVDFHDMNMPEQLTLLCEISGFAVQDGEKPDATVAFSFVLDFNADYIHRGKEISLHQSFVMDGQFFMAESLALYPTHMRLQLDAKAENTAWLQGLTLFGENEKGQRFETPSQGVSAAGTALSPSMDSFRLESAFFTESESLTLYITAAVWLDKTMETIQIDLEKGKASALPEGVALQRAERVDGDWILTFSAENLQKDAVYPLFQTKYFDETGNERGFSAYTLTAEGTNRFQMQFTLENYPFATVILSPAFSRISVLPSPVVIVVPPTQ